MALRIYSRAGVSRIQSISESDMGASYPARLTKVRRHGTTVRSRYGDLRLECYY
jgi:hypothetical protein